MKRDRIVTAAFHAFLLLLVAASAIPLLFALIHPHRFLAADTAAGREFLKVVGVSPDEADPSPMAAIALDFVGVGFALVTATLIGWQRGRRADLRLLAVFLAAFALMIGPLWTFLFEREVPVEWTTMGFIAATVVAAVAFVRFSYLFPHPFAAAELAAHQARPGALRRALAALPGSSVPLLGAGRLRRGAAASVTRLVPARAHAVDATLLLLLACFFAGGLAMIVAALAAGALQTPRAAKATLAVMAGAVLLLRYTVAAGVAATVLVSRISALARTSRADGAGAAAWTAHLALPLLAASLVLFTPLPLAAAPALAAGGLVAASRVAGPARLRARNFDQAVALLSAGLLAVDNLFAITAACLLLLPARARVARAALPQALHYPIAHPFRWMRVELRRPGLAWACAAAFALLGVATMVGQAGKPLAAVYFFCLLSAVFGAVVLGVRNLRLGYALTSDEQARRRVLWIVNGCVTALAVLVVTAAAVFLPPAAADAVPRLSLNLLLPIVAISTFVGVFYRGAIDPELVLRKTSFCGVAGVIVVVAFAVLEEILKEVVKEFFEMPEPLVPLLAGGLAALCVLPLHRWVEPWVELAVGYFFPGIATETKDGPAMLVMADIVEFVKLDERDEHVAAQVLLSLRSLAKEGAVRHKGKVVESMRDRVTLCFTAAPAALEVGRDLLEDFSATLARQALPAQQLRVAVHCGHVFWNEAGDLHGRVLTELADICAAAQPGTLRVSPAAAAELAAGGGALGGLARAGADVGAAVPYVLAT